MDQMMLNENMSEASSQDQNKIYEEPTHFGETNPGAVATTAFEYQNNFVEKEIAIEEYDDNVYPEEQI